MKFSYNYNKKEHVRRYRPVVLITGCGSGLGLELAQSLYLNKHYRVVITARIKSLPLLRDKFHESRRFIIRELDVNNGDRIHELVNEVCVLWGRVDILVNNAGICFRSIIEHMDNDSEMLQLQTNYLGPMRLIRAVLPVMREQGGGRILNVSSVSGMVAMPTMASYSASKHALEGASEALWYEGRPYNIKISLIQPGFIHSESFKKVVLTNKAIMSAKLYGPHSEYYSSMTPFIERLMAFSPATPQSIAKKIIKVFQMDDPPLRIAVTFDAILFKWIRKLLPSFIFHKLMYWLLPGSTSWGVKKDPRIKNLSVKTGT